MRALVAFALVASMSDIASADAIRMPRDCPPGWQGRRIGHEARCFPIVCAGDGSCASDARCRDVRRCYRSEPVSRGRGGNDAPPPHEWIPEDRLCDDHASCGEGGRCRTSRECVVEPPRPAPGATMSTTSAACSATHAASSSAAGSFALVIAAVLRRRVLRAGERRLRSRTRGSDRPS